MSGFHLQILARRCIITTHNAISEDMDIIPLPIQTVAMQLVTSASFKTESMMQ
jgi:hypothetical protein